MEAPEGIRVEGDHVGRSRKPRILGDRDGRDRHGVAHEADAEGCEELGGHRSEGHPGGSFPGARPFEDGPRLLEAVLLHAGEVGVPGPGAGEGRVPGKRVEFFGIHRVGGHDALPFGPLGVGDLDRNGPALGAPVPDPPENPHRVQLELHPGTAPVTEPPARQRGLDVGGRHRHPGGKTFKNSDHGRAMGFSGS